MEKQSVVGLSMRGGRKDQFFFCLLEYFPDKKRWFLSSLLQVKDTEEQDGDDAIRSWIDDYQLKNLVLDFPLSQPACHSCTLECPGINLCDDENVKQVRHYMDLLLKEDEKIHVENPKDYEFARNVQDTFDFHRDITHRQPTDHLLSRSFKRRLKKGYLPYWNRGIDFYIWSNYYDQLLEFFNISFDSFGNTSLMVEHRMTYLKRHFPKDLALFEAHTQVVLIELLRAGVISKKDILLLSDLDLGIEAKLDIVKRIEQKLNIFIYDHDLELLVRNPRAFDSFLLSVAGLNLGEGKSIKLPDYTRPKESRFIIPRFS